MVGMIVAEILQGIKVPEEAKLVRQGLEKLPYLEMTRNVWKKAGEISASLHTKGITIPLSDLIIAALELSEDQEIFTSDPYFKEVWWLRFHNPT